MSDDPRGGNADHPEGGSCDLPEPTTLRTDLAHRRFDQATFSWDGIAPQVYKRGDAGSSGLGWRDVVRHTLAGGEAQAFQLRYFEIAPAGYSSLEKHAHAHTIVVLRGRGKVVAGRGVFTVEPFDLVVIPPRLPHQFVNMGTDPFGFLCLVDAERDTPQAVAGDELESLLRTPDVRATVRIADPIGGRGPGRRSGA